VSKAEGIRPGVHLTHARAVDLIDFPDLFEEVNLAGEKHLYENHFHNQLKAKLLDCEAVTQIVRQTTIASFEYLNRRGKPGRTRCQVNLPRSEKPETGCAIIPPPLHSAIHSPLRPEKSASLIARRDGVEG
jgi:hypothetical protein